MTALLWKELRENAYKVGTGLGVVVLVHLLRQLQGFNASFAEAVDTWALAVGGLCAVVLAMDAVAGERSRGTLEFLLVRPTTTLSLLAAKWLVGAAGLLLVVATFWAMVYATPLTGLSLWNGEPAQILADVSWPAMVYAWYLPLLVVYTLVFLASTATETPAEAAGGAAVIGLAGLFAVMFAGYLFPRIEHTWTALPDLGAVGFTRGGDVVHLANDGTAVLARTLLGAGLVAAGLTASVLILSRFRDLTLGWRTMVVSAFVLLTCALTVPRLLPWEEELHPVATLGLGEARGLVVDGGHAYTFGHDSLRVVDVRDPRAPRLLASLRHRPGWTLSDPVLAGDHLCGLARLRAAPGDSLAVHCFRIADPAAPAVAGAIAVGGRIRDPGAFGYGYTAPVTLASAGATVILGTTGRTRAMLRAYQVGAQGPRPSAEIVLERYDYPERLWDGEVAYGRSYMLARHDFGLATTDARVYVGMHSGLRILEVTEDGGLRPRGQLDLQDATEFLRGGARGVTVRGDTAWVDRLWPRRKVVVDVGDADRPAIVHDQPHEARTALAVAAGFHYRVHGPRVSVYAAADPYPRPVPVLALPQRERRWGTAAAALRDGYGYVVVDDLLAVFELPAGN